MDIGVLEEDYSSEWSSPSFAIPKKNGSSTIRVVTDFRKLNLFLKHRTPSKVPYPVKNQLFESFSCLTNRDENDSNI
jgi:hypothetical protein